MKLKLEWKLEEKKISGKVRRVDKIFIAYEMRIRLNFFF